MIFVTVGTQLPFERLIKAVDEWASNHPDMEVFAQIGRTQYQPQHMTCVETMSPLEYTQKFNDARVVVSHAGMGTIISGLELAKPLVLMPRLAAQGEHRNDHQLGTAEKFSIYKQIQFVNSSEELNLALTSSLDNSSSTGTACPQPSVNLIAKLKSFVNEV